MNGIGRRFRQGAWGLLRVLPGRIGDLQPLPGHDRGRRPGAADADGRPPAGRRLGRAPVPDRRPGAHVRGLGRRPPEHGGGRAGHPRGLRGHLRGGRRRGRPDQPEPLVLHAAAGECVTVQLTNERATARGVLRTSTSSARTLNSSGVNAGYNPEQTVAPGEERTYRYYADSEKIGSAVIADFGDFDSGAQGLYGAFVVAPAGARVRRPAHGPPARRRRPGGRAAARAATPTGTSASCCSTTTPSSGRTRCPTRRRSTGRRW